MPTNRLTALCPPLKSSRGKLYLVPFQKVDDLRQFPNVVRESGGHRGRDSQAGMDSGEVVVHEVERTREPRESIHLANLSGHVSHELTLGINAVLGCFTLEVGVNRLASILTQRRAKASREQAFTFGESGPRHFKIGGVNEAQHAALGALKATERAINSDGLAAHLVYALNDGSQLRLVVIVFCEPASGPNDVANLNAFGFVVGCE